MELGGQRVLLEGVADRKSAELRIVVKSAHVPANGNRFVGFKSHEAFNQKNRFFAVAKGKLIIYCEIGDALPNPGCVILDIANRLLIEVGLADIVQKR